MEGVELCRELPEARGIYWMSNLLLADDAPIEREELRAFMRDRGVDTRPVFPPIGQYPIWTTQQRSNPVATRIGRQAMNLPSGVLLRREHVRRVADSVREALGASSR